MMANAKKQKDEVDNNQIDSLLSELKNELGTAPDNRVESYISTRLYIT